MPSATAHVLESVNLVFGGHIAMALIIGVLMIKHDAVKFKAATEQIPDLCFWMLLAAIIGSRCSYALFNTADFLNEPGAFFKFWDGGLSVSGGIVCAIVAGGVYIKKNRLPLRGTADIMAPALSIGHFFIWMGCFFSGTCGRNHPNLSPVADSAEMPSHALQGATSDPLSLLLACGYFVIFAVLLWVGSKRTFEGQLICIFLALHGVFRVFLAFMSADSSPGWRFWDPHLPARITAAALVLGAIGAYGYLWRSARKKRHAS
jgi:phosphatidylglycerol:prolipoprotein diacylglycerol transferase